MNYSITDDGQYQCAECEKLSATLLAHNSHYRRHKNAAAKEAAQVVTPAAPARTVRTVAGAAQPAKPQPAAQLAPQQQPAPPPKGRSWIDRILYGND